MTRQTTLTHTWWHSRSAGSQATTAFALQDVDANPVRLEDFRGKSVILNLLYSRGQKQCPLHSQKLA